MVEFRRLYFIRKILFLRNIQAHKPMLQQYTAYLSRKSRTFLRNNIRKGQKWVKGGKFTCTQAQKQHITKTRSLQTGSVFDAAQRRLRR